MLCAYKCDRPLSTVPAIDLPASRLAGFAPPHLRDMKKTPPYVTLRRRAFAAALSSLGILLTGPTAQATTLYWDSDATYNNGTIGGTGTWNTSTLNWDDNLGTGGGADVAWATNTITGDTAVFGGTAGTVTLGAAVNALGLQFLTTGYTIGGSNTLTLGTGGIDASSLSSGTTAISATTLTMGANQSWNVGSGSALNVSSALNGGGFTLTKTGQGTLTLSGTSTGFTTSSLTVTQGTVNVSGQLNVGSNQGASTLTVNAASGNTATFGMTSSSSSFATGNQITFGNTTGGTAIFNMSGGYMRTQATGTNPAQRDIRVGQAGFGVANVTGGSIDIYGYLVGGITTSGATGIWNISGGSVSVLDKGTNNFASTLGATANTTGVMNVTGTGTFNSNVSGKTASGLFVGENGQAYLNVSGTGNVNAGADAGSNGLRIGHVNVATAKGVVNLGAVGVGGGTITTNRVSTAGTTATSYFNFHGGTLKSTTTPNAAFMTGLTGAYVYGEGGTIDNNGQSITIGQSMLAPSAKGASAISTTGFGTTTGYTTAPLVTITGGSGTGMTANAIVDGSGVITGFTITNPGTGYIATDTLTVTLSGGGYATTSTSTTAITLADNVSGGMTFSGSGTTILSGTNTYTGATTVSAGTLSVTGSLASGSAVSVASGSTLRGTGTIGGTTTIASGGTLAAGTSTSAIGTLTFSSTLDTSAASVSLKLNSTSGTFDLITSSGAVTLGSATLSLSDIGSGSWTGTSSAFSILHGASIAGTFSGLSDGSSIVVGSNTFTINYTATDVTLTVSAVPEPSTYAVIAGLGVLALAGCRRRRTA